MLRTTFLTALAAASAISATPAFAGSPDTASVKIASGGLNLSTEAGASIVLGRIQAAARSVCGPEPSIVELRRSDLHRACVKTTVDRTVASLNNPLLARLNRAQLVSTAIADVR